MNSTDLSGVSIWRIRIDITTLCGGFFFVWRRGKLLRSRWNHMSWVRGWVRDSWEHKSVTFSMVRPLGSYKPSTQKERVRISM